MRPAGRAAPAGGGGSLRRGGWTARPAQPCKRAHAGVQTQVERPGDPATRRPGDPATRRPGDPATRRPGDPATRRPGDPATRRPGDPATRRPGDPATRRPGDPATRRPGDPATRRPGDPATRRPGDPATRRPGDPATRRPGDPATRRPLYCRNPQRRLSTPRTKTVRSPCRPDPAPPEHSLPSRAARHASCPSWSSCRLRTCRPADRPAPRPTPHTIPPSIACPTCANRKPNPAANQYNERRQRANAARRTP